MSLKNFTIAWMISDFVVSGNLEDNRHGTLKLKQWFVKTLINETDGTMYREFEDYYVPYSKCKYGVNFFSASKEQFALYGLEKFYCPDVNNLTLQGNWYTPEYICLQLMFERCTG